MSPLLPFAASNYLYGLTSVEVRPYFIASWLGMLPGTWAYVSAGSLGRDFLNGGSSTFSPLQLGMYPGGLNIDSTIVANLIMIFITGVIV